jgi:hypothetical protein
MGQAKEKTTAIVIYLERYLLPGIDRINRG